MNEIIVNSIGVKLPSWSSFVSEFAVKVLKEIKRENWELSVLFCDNKTITDLNKQYRRKNEATDVLSFKLGETIKKGSII